MFPISLALYLYEMIDFTKTLSENHCMTYMKWNHYAVHLKLTRCFMSVMSPETGRKKKYMDILIIKTF